MARWMSMEQLVTYLGATEDQVRALLHQHRVRPPAAGRQIRLEEAQLQLLEDAARAASNRQT